MTDDYRSSHAAPGYGATYDRTYQEGYYRDQWERIERPLVERVLTSLAVSGARRYLDFACGTGRILSVGESVFAESWGVDVSEAMIGYASERCPRSTIVLQDLTKQPLNSRFDVISAFRFFLNAQDTLRVEAARAMASHLVPGGRLVANVHVNRSSPLGLAYRFRNWYRGVKLANVLGLDEFATVLGNSGFEVETVDWYSFWPRTGWVGAAVAQRVMVPFDRVVRSLPSFAQRWGQSFLVVARRT